MTRPVVVDGRVAHAQGSFALVLSGEERARAHADILKATDPSLLASGQRPISDRVVADIVRRDPSLLLEPIPSRYPLPRTGMGATWAEADPVWRNYSNWYGNWLTRLSDPDVDFVQAVRVALEAGIHPDDSSVWADGRLLAREGWCTSPNKLGLALAFGASPTLGRGWEESYLRTALVDVRSALTGDWGTVDRFKLLDAVKSAEMLIDAGTTELDLPLPAPSLPAVLSAAEGHLSAVGYLLDSGGGGMRGQGEADAVVYALLRSLHGAGVDIDRPNCMKQLPPVVMALRCLNLSGACKLIELGCRTDDAHLVRGSGSWGVMSLLEEAHDAGGEMFRTRVVQAIMERQFAASEAGAPAALRAPRRRMSV